MKYNNAAEVKAYLWQELELDSRSITFNVFELADDSRVYVSGGIVDCQGDIYECDRFYDVGYERSDDAELEVSWVDSHMIGDGEAEHADSDEAAVLEEIAADSPSAFGDFIREYADNLVSIKGFKIDNPAYDRADEEDDDDDAEI